MSLGVGVQFWRFALIAVFLQVVGCEAVGPAAGSREEFTNTVGNRVIFRFDEEPSGVDADATVERQAVWLIEHSRYDVVVEGHYLGPRSREYALALGYRCAVRIKESLVSLGIHPDRVRVATFGREQKIAEGSAEAERCLAVIRLSAARPLE